MKNEEKILEMLERLEKTQDRTILAVTSLQESVEKVQENLSHIVTREEYLTGQDQILKKLDTLETEKIFTDSRITRLETQVKTVEAKMN